MTEQIRVLFVGEDARSRAEAERSLPEHASLDVLVASTAGDAVDALGDGSVDCVAVEHADGGTDAVRVLRVVRDADPAVPVVVFASDSSEALASEAVSLNASEYVSRDGDGDAFAALARACHDAAATYRAEQDVAMLNDLARNVYERITDAFFALDRRWQFTYLNEQAEELLDVSSEEIVGENVWEAFPDAVGTQFYTEYHRAMATQEPVTFSERYPPLEKTFEVRAFPSEDGLSVHFRSVTEDGERARADVFELTDVLTHDLLDSIGETRAALADARESSSCDPAEFEDVERSLDRMTDLVNHAVALAHGEPTDRTPPGSQ